MKLFIFPKKSNLKLLMKQSIFYCFKFFLLACFLSISTTTFSQIKVNNQNNVGIGNDTPSKRLHVTGNTLITNSLTIGSDLPSFVDYGFTVNTPNGGLLLNRTNSADAFIRLSNNSGHGGQLRSGGAANQLIFAQLDGVTMGYMNPNFTRIKSLYTQSGDVSGGGSQYQILMGFADGITGSTFRITQGIKTRHDSGNADNNAIDFYTWKPADGLAPSVHAMTLRNGNVGVKELEPTRTLDVNGQVRIRDLITDTPTRLIGADADGDLNQVTLGSGLNLNGSELGAVGSQYAQLLYNGSVGLSGTISLTLFDDASMLFYSQGSFSSPQTNRIRCDFAGSVRITIGGAWEGGNGIGTNHLLIVRLNNSNLTSYNMLTANNAPLSGYQRGQMFYLNDIIIDVAQNDYFEFYYTAPTGSSLVFPLLNIQRIK